MAASATLPVGYQGGFHIPNYLLDSRTGAVVHPVNAGAVYGPVITQPPKYTAPIASAPGPKPNIYNVPIASVSRAGAPVGTNANPRAVNVRQVGQQTGYPNRTYAGYSFFGR